MDPCRVSPNINPVGRIRGSETALFLFYSPNIREKLKIITLQ